MADKSVENRIEEALEQMRPFFEADGGDMRLHKVTDDMIAQIVMVGACSNCSMSDMTLSNGVEEAIRKVAPEIKGLKAFREEELQY